ncbi:MAG: hypothetical protein R3F11_03320 [Verrucomicrobiales bacterium]
MCCFSRPVESVSATKIFARLVGSDRQATAYQMHLSAKEDLAMILPIPVAQPAAEDAVKFIDLSGYKEMFGDLHKGFPVPESRALSFGAPKIARNEAGSLPLKVESVGSYDASFVPAVKDFARLDERFRLPAETWDQLPQFKEFGFAVFKLKKGNSEVHPMGFTFPTALRGTVFFPTVHIHDGKVHEEEEFDHVLYAQAADRAVIGGKGWEESPGLAGSFTKPKSSQGMIWPDLHVYRLKVEGMRKNEDILARLRALGG